MKNALRCLPILFAFCAGILVAPVDAQFTSPRITFIINPTDTGTEGPDVLKDRRYYLDRGLESSINKGDVLNVYREKHLNRNSPRPMRILIGAMTITESQQGSSIGEFEPNSAAMAHPMIRFKTAMKSDIIVPRLVIDSRVLFDAGSANLKGQVAQEFDKVAAFVQTFSPSKLILSGHTDSDGDAEANLALSLNRANLVRDYLLNTFSDFITPNMLEAKGYGEDQPIAPNDTPENKKLNRRIEVLVWW
ncbi:MAG: OmpA family protein [Candidatus Latescibacterota bacterium]|nr:OmpA family protein [Candidatus Latescibacterota bacterium]